MVSIESLPDEVLLHIFHNLNVKELLLLQLVNHRWRRISMDRTFFSTISLTENDSNSLISVLLKQHKNIVRHLNIVGHSDIDLLAPLISECKNLESLSIKLCNGGYELFRVIENCAKVNVIILQHLSVQGINEILEILSRRPMKKINIRNMDDIRDNYLSNLSAVEDLRLKSLRVRPNAIYGFCLHNANFLTTLKLIVSDESWLLPSSDLNETLFKAIGNCSLLKSLCLGPQITTTLNDTGFSYIAKLDCLCTFQIHNAIGVSTSTFKEFFGRPSSMRLHKISLHKCPSVNSRVLQQIGESCNQLQKFTLDKPKAGKWNKDLSDITKYIKNCKRIRKLHLYGMDIIVAKLLHLMPEYFPELESLRYSNTDKPMMIPAFLCSLQCYMPGFEVCGMQWTHNLYVNCKRKTNVRNSSVVNDKICGNAIKMKPVYC